MNVRLTFAQKKSSNAIKLPLLRSSARKQRNGAQQINTVPCLTAAYTRQVRGIRFNPG